MKVQLHCSNRIKASDEFLSSLKMVIQYSAHKAKEGCSFLVLNSVGMKKQHNHREYLRESVAD